MFLTSAAIHQIHLTVSDFQCQCSSQNILIYMALLILRYALISVAGRIVDTEAEVGVKLASSRCEVGVKSAEVGVKS